MVISIITIETNFFMLISFLLIFTHLGDFIYKGTSIIINAIFIIII
jgi:hypothetical protein